MAALQSIWTQAVSIFSNLFDRPDWRTWLDIAIVAVVLYNIFKMFAHTRANSVIKGVAIVLLVTWLSEVLQLNAINWLLLQMLNMGALLLVILFQPEIRRGLEQIGRSSGWLNRALNSSGATKEAEKAISELVRALTNLSKRRVGALIVLEQETGLSDVVESGTRIDAEISAPLVENIFEPNTPLHDGAMIVRDLRIVAAACILQLSEETSISRELGTRHRAAIGTSETTDAIVLIVSEETGTISYARDGRLTRYLDAASLTKLLERIFLPAENKTLTPLKSLTARRKEARNEKK